MVNDDEVFDPASIDPASMPSGPRRSTFTPPPGGAAGAATPRVDSDDEDLASAVSSDPDPFATSTFADGPSAGGPINFSPEMNGGGPEPIVWSLGEDDSTPVNDIPTWSVDDVPPATAFPPTSPPPTSPPPTSPPPTMPPPSAMPEGLVTDRAPAETNLESEQATPAWISAPAPNRMQAVDASEGAPPPPPLPGNDAAPATGAVPARGAVPTMGAVPTRGAVPTAPPLVAPQQDLTPPLASGTPAAGAAMPETTAPGTDAPATSAPDPAAPRPPQTRRSRRDAELIVLAEEAAKQPGGTLSAIEQLEEELQIRQQEAAEALIAEPSVAEPSVAEQPAAESVPVVPAVPVDPALMPLPSWDVPAPSDSWAPGPEFEPDTPPSASTSASSPPPPPLVEPPAFGGPPLLPSQVASHPPADEPDDLVIAEVIDEVGDEQPLPTPDPKSSGDFSFDDLIGGAGAALIEPMPVASGEPVPTETGSVAIVNQTLDEEPIDDVDFVDSIIFGAAGVGAAAVAGERLLTGPVELPSGPISVPQIPADETVLLENDPVAAKVFSLESSGLEATPTEIRAGRAARMFWLWFAANSSIVSIGLGAAVFAIGMSLRQSIVAVLAGVALSFIPLGLTTLAGKRSGQPTMVVSRATFGLVGNIVPALLALVTRLFWGAVLLWLLASSVVVVLAGADLTGPLGERLLLLISLAAGLLLAVLIAFAGYPLLARIQLILSLVSGILIVGLVVMTAQYIDIPFALTTPDGSWLLTITGAVLVFSVVGLAWANSGGDLARYQRTESSGAASMLWANFGATLPAFVLIGYGALLAASNESIASGFLSSPLDTLAGMLPSWYPVPLIAAACLSLLSGVVVTLYSGGFALQAIGVRLPRQWAVVIVAIVLGGLAFLQAFGVAGGINETFRDVATTLAVPTAAWAGIFAAEMMIRNRRFESTSLLTRGGIYPSIRWVNFVGFFAISAVGFGLTSAIVGWLSWQGFLFGALGIPLDSELAGSDLGVLVALGLGLILPIVAGIPAIRKQEAAEV